MLSTNIILELYKVCVDIKCTAKKVKINRHNLKVIIHSLMEQICHIYFDSKPTGIQNVRILINSNINAHNEEDMKLLQSFNAILREYNDVFSKDYTDHSADLLEFVDNQVRHFCTALFNHSRYISDINVERLRRLW